MDRSDLDAHGSDVGCPDEVALLAYSEGRLDADALQSLERHFDRCSRCRWVLQLFGDASATAVPDAVLELPALPARYALRAKLGVGGQGQVWSVWDRDLRREVALKFVWIGSDAQRTRLLHEARALAALDHPNVLEVFDIDLTGDVGFLSMRLCPEGSLADRVGGAHRWPQVLRWFIDAARGLAAVHRAGVLHRDVKPSNLLVEADGRVSVADFGLAMPARAAPTPQAYPSATTGPVCGTPAYLAPEVRAGGPHSAASDQYSFFASLVHVLSGQLPRGGHLRRCGAPIWLQRVMRRGLQHDPARRFADLGEVSSALCRPRRRRAAVLVAVPSAIVLLVVAAREGPAPARPEPCVERTPIPWDLAARARLGRAIAVSGLASAGDLANEVDARLDRYVRGWRTADRQACEAGRDSPCLSRQSERTRAVVEWLEARPVDADGVMALQRVLPELVAYEHCERAVMSPAAGDPTERSDVAAAVHGAFATDLLESHAAGQEALSTALAHPRIEAFADLEAEALRQVVAASLAAGGVADVREERRWLDRAADAAVRSDDPVVSARVWLQRALALCLSPSERDRAMAFARAAIRRAGNPQPAAAHLDGVVAWHALLAGQFERTEGVAGRLVARARALGMPALVGRGLTMLGQARAGRGDLDAARVHFEEARIETRRVYPEGDTALTEIDLALVGTLIRAGRNTESLAVLEELGDRLHPLPAHARIRGRFWEAYGRALVRSGQPSEALVAFHEARAEAVATGDDFAGAAADLSLAYSHHHLGQDRDARRHFARGAAVLRDLFADEHRILQRAELLGARLELAEADAVDAPTRAPTARNGATATRARPP